VVCWRCVPQGAKSSGVGSRHRSQPGGGFCVQFIRLKKLRRRARKETVPAAPVSNWALKNPQQSRGDNFNTRLYRRIATCFRAVRARLGRSENIQSVAAIVTAAARYRSILIFPLTDEATTTSSPTGSTGSTAGKSGLTHKLTWPPSMNRKGRLRRDCFRTASRAGEWLRSRGSYRRPLVGA